MMILFLTAILVTACNGYTWMSSSPVNGSGIYACVGDTVTLGWSISLATGEAVNDMEWFFEGSGQSSQMIATFVGSQFVRIAPNRPSLKLFNIYGLQFDLQAQQEYGTYSLHVNIIRNNSLARDSKYIYVGSPEPPSIQNQQLRARLLPEAKLVSQDWHVQLGCGNFQTRGEPPFTVVWKSPSGIIISSSEFVDNEYILSISNPVEEGTYSCHLMNSDPTARCVQTNASLQFSAEVDVEAKDVLLAIYNASCGHEMEDVASSIAEHISRASSPAVRLVNSTRPWRGRVEVFYNNQWGTVCDDNFTVSDAIVVCRMLGLQVNAPAVRKSAFYGPGTLPILLDDVVCRGNETSIFSCGHASIGVHNCVHSKDVGVDCLSKH